MKNYYHGTSYYSAYRILKEGFRLLSGTGQYGVKGQGTYITDNLGYALFMGQQYSSSNSPNKPCIIQCEIMIEGPIMWSEKEYDLKVIKYLKKKFNKKIVDYNYSVSKFIPKNKNLTKKESINLINFWHEKHCKERQKQMKNNRWEFEKTKGDSSFIENTRKLLMFHGFSGWGQYTHEAWDSDEIVIFNPSQVKPKKVYEATGECNDEDSVFRNVKLGKEISILELKHGYEHEKQDLKYYDEKYGENLSADMYK